MATSNFVFLKIWQLLCSFSQKKPFVQYFALIFLFSEQTTQVQHLVDDQIPHPKAPIFPQRKKKKWVRGMF
jgi:hypothetical protein